MAIVDYEKILQIDPHDYNAMVNLSSLKPQTPLDNMKEDIKSAIYFNMGIASYQKGDIKEGLAMIKKALTAGAQQNEDLLLIALTKMGI